MLFKFILIGCPPVRVGCFRLSSSIPVLVTALFSRKMCFFGLSLYLWAFAGLLVVDFRWFIPPASPRPPLFCFYFKMGPEPLSTGHPWITQDWVSSTTLLLNITFLSVWVEWVVVGVIGFSFVVHQLAHRPTFILGNYGVSSINFWLFLTNSLPVCPPSPIQALPAIEVVIIFEVLHCWYPPAS